MSFNLPQMPSPAQLPKVANLNITEEYKIFNENFRKFFDIPRSPKKTESESNSDSSIVQLQDLQSTKIFALVLGTRLSTPICKGKYFSFKIYLKQLSELSLPINQTLDLEILIFNQDRVVITRNMKGQEILKGNSSQTMNFSIAENVHIAYFRIQITEVSSHFIGKKIIMKICPKSSDFLKTMGWEIKPFTMDLIVKAKEVKIKN